MKQKKLTCALWAKTLAFVLAVTNILCPFMVKFILTMHPADEQSRQNTHKLADAKQ